MGLDSSKEDDPKTLYKVMGQAQFRATKKYERRMTAWDFWNTGAATTVTTDGTYGMAAVLADMLTSRVGKKAREMNKLDIFELYLGNLLVGYGFSLKQVLAQSRIPLSRTPKKKTLSLNKSGLATPRRQTPKKILSPTKKVKSISPTKKLANSTLRPRDNPDSWLGTATP